MIPRYSLPKMQSVWSEENKFSKMLQIEILTAEALAKSGKIPRRSATRIKKKARFNIKEIYNIEQATQHDVVAFVTNVAQYIGADAKYLHLGLTSSDLLDTTLSLQLREAGVIILEDLKILSGLLAGSAQKYKDTVCIGRTHGVHAEPITLGLKFCLWFDETNRNIKRLEDAVSEICVGKISGAVGNYAHLEPRVEEYICRKLGLRPVNVATQVIQRDIHAQFLTVLAIIGASLEKFALEIRHLQKTEVREVEEPFGRGQKGSSAMPHKRNPVICERISGLARLLRTNSLAAIENIPLWHERDISHSSVERVIMPDSCLILDYMLNKFIEVMKGLIVYPENMLANLVKTRGLIFSQRVLLTLMNKGLSRMTAYDIVQDASMKVWKNPVLNLEAALLHDKRVLKYLSKKEIEACFNLDYYLRYVERILKKTGIK
ncbi:MAG: adenylosuccinate lyase [Candidatus Omnitrophota bacterium]